MAPEPNSAAEQFDAHNPNLTRNRFDLMAQMRGESPVTFVPSLGVYAVTRWQEVRDVLGDAATFASSEAFSGGVHLAPQALEIFPLSSPFFAMNLINVDKPLHKRLRDPLMAAFHIKRMNALLPSVVADVDELLETMLLDAVVAHGGDAPRADLLPMLCKPLPLRTICRLMGILINDAPQLSIWSDALIGFQTPGLPGEVQIEAAQGLKALENYVRELIAIKTAQPDEGLVSALIEGRAKGENDLSDDELVADIGITFSPGTIWHGVAEEGVTVCSIAEVIGRRLGLPIRSIDADEAPEHFGFLGGFLGLDSPASSAITQQKLGWYPDPSHAGLLDDLENGETFSN